MAIRVSSVGKTDVVVGSVSPGSGSFMADIVHIHGLYNHKMGGANELRFEMDVKDDKGNIQEKVWWIVPKRIFKSEVCAKQVCDMLHYEPETGQTYCDTLKAFAKMANWPVDIGKTADGRDTFPQIPVNWGLSRGVTRLFTRVDFPVTDLDEDDSDSQYRAG